MRTCGFSLLLALAFLALHHGVCHGGQLKKIFYLKSCPRAETIVRNITWSRVAANPALPAKLLRLQYHDCFVRGCDASVLLDSTNGTSAEKDAIPNRSLEGFDVIDEIKAKLEVECPLTVSCADILALAARDAVSFQFGRAMWGVLSGRRDGRVSLASEALDNLPSPASDFNTLKQQFADNGLNIPDLVALSGAHTIGVAHCVVFTRRLFNFTGNNDSDPSLDPGYAATLKAQCSSPRNTVAMDCNSSSSFDSHYFVALSQNQGLFTSDATLLTDKHAANFARFYQKFNVFLAQFGHSMKKMGAIAVLTNNEGEIRKNCRAVN
ncbi:hypothetical protein BT93_H2224 [Corymbia citriodora subsp. variegata]|nr:hypothetical protein BT93_H2224 [Corymbia citriodora subsp. variegata]